MRDKSREETAHPATSEIPSASTKDEESGAGAARFGAPPSPPLSRPPHIAPLDGRPFNRDLLAWLAIALALLAAWSFAFVPLRASQDEWWHLKTGKWIVEHGRLPTTDIFTYSGEGLRWHNHEWLSQILLYVIYATGEGTPWGGLRTLITAKAALVMATFAVVLLTARRRCGSWRVAAFVTLVAADVARRTIYPRPPIFSYLLLAAFLALLWEWKQRRLRQRWLWLLPPTTILWANLHGMVPLAVAAVGAFAAGELFETAAAWWRSRRAGGSRSVAAQRIMRCRLRNFRFLALLAVAVGVAAMINPSGPEIFFLGRKFMADPVLKRVIAEMLPTPGLFVQIASDQGTRWVWNPLYVSFWGSLLALAILFLARRGRLATGADYVLLAFFSYQAVMHVRLLPLYAVAASPSLAWLVAEQLRRLPAHARRQAVAMLPLASAALFTYYAFVVAEPPPQTFFRRNLDLVRGKDREEADYPTPVMRFVLRVGFPDRLFSEINYCGYMIWWLSPEHHKLFTDNRFDLFGSRYYLEEATVVHGAEKEEARIGRGWQEILDGYSVNFLVLSRSAPINAKLRASGRWDLVYYWIPQDRSPREGFNVWLRRDPRFAAIRERALRCFREDNPAALMPDEFEQWLATHLPAMAK